jgi:diguanylate cyclase (GGDEF)-like protein/PAS domain S-box-containing protein
MVRGWIAVRIAGITAGFKTAFTREASPRAGTLERRTRSPGLDPLISPEPILRSLADQAIVGTYIIQDGRFAYVNPRGAEMYGYTVEEMLALDSAIELVCEEDRPLVAAQIRRRIEGIERAVHYSFRSRRRDGTLVDVEVHGTRVEFLGRPAISGVALDITERRGAEQALRASEERYRLLFERNLAGVYRSTPDGKILECNDAFARIFGYADRNEMLAVPAWDFYESRRSRYAYLAQLKREKTLTNYEVRLRRRDGAFIWILENGTLVEGGDGHQVIEGTLIDITSLKRAEEKIEFQAYHDALTGLPNRLLFMDRLGRALARARRLEGRVAVMLLDLDHFMGLNESLGESLGDELLKEVARRMTEAVREDDTLARIGGDEFALVFQDLQSDDTPMRIAEDLLSSVARPYELDRRRVFATASIGVSLYPSDGDDPETLLMSANNAMTLAKDSGRNSYQLCTLAIASAARHHLSIEYGLREALERGDFLLRYQPIVALENNRIVGAEALIRWKHPERGLIEPKFFIPQAEESHLILGIGEWVLESACRQASLWQKESRHPIGVSVNISTRQFRRGNLLNTISRILEATRLPPERLTLEITEAVAIHDEELAKKTLHELRELGVNVLIDDFGTGYSSLVYLKRFPITGIKIDQSFVRDIPGDSGDTAIVSSMVNLARSLGLRTIGEGVETNEQRQLLFGLGCDEYQGYLFSRPIPADEFLAMSKTPALR